MSENMEKVPSDDPMMIAWNKVKTGFEYGNSLKWATYMSFQQHDESKPHGPVTLHHPHVEGALWNMFRMGYMAAKGTEP